MAIYFDVLGFRHSKEQHIWRNNSAKLNQRSDGAKMNVVE